MADASNISIGISAKAKAFDSACSIKIEQTNSLIFYSFAYFLEVALVVIVAVLEGGTLLLMCVC